MTTLSWLSSNARKQHTSSSRSSRGRCSLPWNSAKLGCVAIGVFSCGSLKRTRFQPTPQQKQVPSDRSGHPQDCKPSTLQLLFTISGRVRSTPFSRDAVGSTHRRVGSSGGHAGRRGKSSGFRDIGHDFAGHRTHHHSPGARPGAQLPPPVAWEHLTPHLTRAVVRSTLR